MTIQRARAARFTALFRSEYRYVWNTLRRLGVSERDAEDVAHEVFVRAYDKLEMLVTDDAPRSWFFTFAYRAAADYRKLARHRVEVLEEHDAPHNAAAVDDALAAEDQVHLVQHALGKIDFERRAILVAFEMDDVPMKDIANTMKIPLFTAYSRLRIAREEFRDAVARLQRKGELA